MPVKVSQAVILSAGLGTRLQPITDNIPKVMAPLAGKSLLEWHIEQFRKHGVSDFFINLHYLPEVITNYFGDGAKWDVRIRYFLEKPNILGTAGGVKSFEDKLGDAFFVIYGDMFSMVDYGKMAEAFRKKPSDAIGMMVVGENDHPQDSDLAEVDDNLKFLKVYCKPHKELPKKWKTLDAVYVLNRKILQYVPSGAFYDLDRQLLPDIVSRGEKFYGYETSDYLFDIGTPERYRKVEEYARKISRGDS